MPDARDERPDDRWWTLGVVSVAVFMLLLDVTIVNVALPAIQQGLHASFNSLQWVIDAYALTLAAGLLVSGSIADRIGRRRVFIVGIAVFSAASLGSGLAGSPTLLNVMRALQGVGGAMMFATSLALIGAAFTGADRATAFGVFGAVTGGSVAIGPLLGGVLTDTFGWESIFLVNVPVGLGAIVAARARLSESRQPHEGRLDWEGAALFSGALFLLIFSLIRGNDRGWTSPLILAFLAGAAVLLAAFVAVEVRKEHPLFHLELFRKPAFVGASIAAFALSASMFSMFLYLTLYIQNVLGYTPLEAGIRFLPVSMLSFFVGPAAGKLSGHLPTRALLGVGLVLVGTGLLLMGGVGPGDGWTTLLVGFLVAGAGIGLVNPPLASAAIGVVEQRRAGMGSGINSTFRQVGIATGIAGLGAVFTHQVGSHVSSALAGTPAAGQAGRIASAVTAGGVAQVVGSAPQQTRAAIEHAARTAFIDGLNTLFVISAVVALAGGLLAFALVRQRDFVSGHQVRQAAETG